MKNVATTFRGSGSDTLAINHGTSEVSDFAFSELMIWDVALDSSDMNIVMLAMIDFLNSEGSLKVKSCSPCPNMTYGYNNASHPCLACPRGLISFEGSFECSTCPSGTIYNASSTDVIPCSECPAMTFQSSAHLGECIPCPNGTYSLSGWAFCLPNKELAYSIGCADGEREWFTNITLHPMIAGCSGAFQKAGVKKSESIVNHDITCNNLGGDDGLYPNGEECSPSDLCAEGWHICSDAVEVTALSGTGDCDNEGNTQSNEDLFFATGQSTNGALLCERDGVNDIFGCGSGMETDDPEIIFGSRAARNLMLWLDAANYSYAETPLGWKDRSKNGHYFTFNIGYGVSGDVPQVDPDDGEPYMSFVSRFLVYNGPGSGIPFPSSGRYTIFVVTKLKNYTPSDRVLFYGVIGAYQEKIGPRQQDSGFTITPALFSSWNLMVFELGNSAPYFRFSMNGVKEF